MTLSADGHWLASGRRGAVRIWERRTGKLVLTLGQDIERNASCVVWAMTFSDDKSLQAASFGSRFYVWNTTTRALTWQSEDCGETIRLLSFSPDAQQIVSVALFGKTLKLWDLQTGNEDTSGNRFAQALCYSDEHHFAAWYPDIKKIGIWANSPASDMAIKTYSEEDVSVMALSQDHQQLASGSRSGEIAIWDMRSGAHIRKLCDPTKGHDKILSLVFRDNFQVASADSRTINIWNMSDGTLMQTREEKSDRFCLMSFSTDGRLLAYVFQHLARWYLNIWNTATGNCFPISSSEADGKYIASLSFSAGSRQLAWASSDSICLWDVTSGTCTQKLRRYDTRRI